MANPSERTVQINFPRIAFNWFRVHNLLMTLEQPRWGGNAEGGIMRAQKNSMTLTDTAKGYEHKVREILGNKTGEIVRREVQANMNVILMSQGQAQYDLLQKLLARLEPYRAIFADIPEDKDERAAFALALVKYEKSLQ